MAIYKCFYCNKEIDESKVKKRVRCIYCGGKILFKPRVVSTKVKVV